MARTYIHLSDIHFGQESGSENNAHDDVKQRLIDDAAGLATAEMYGVIDGIIVTGDIAYSGKPQEYDEAGAWLDRLTNAVGCPRTAVILVPGNHDIDRGRVSRGCKLMIADIGRGGDKSLDAFLNSDVDREVLFRRFAGYQGFARAYRCEFEPDGGFASDRKVEVAPGRFLRFIGLNSALMCSASDAKGGLFLGGRQRTLPREVGEELVLMSHHPLEWLRDSEETVQFVKSRARVFMFGHEHTASVEVEALADDADLLTISAGAAVPPYAERALVGYTYNLISFDWDEPNDGLAVKICARKWNPMTTSFGKGAEGAEEEVTKVLLCPNFLAAQTQDDKNGERRLRRKEVGSDGVADGSREQSDGDQMDESNALLRLRFFRDLSAKGRLRVLAAVNAIPSSWDEQFTQNMERQLLDSVLQSGGRDRLKEAISKAADEARDCIGGSDG